MGLCATVKFMMVLENIRAFSLDIHINQNEVIDKNEEKFLILGQYTLVNMYKENCFSQLAQLSTQFQIYFR